VLALRRVPIDTSVSCQRTPMTCATVRASRFADRAVFLAASRAPLFTVTLAPVHATERARFDRATLHASSPAAFHANDLTRMVQLYLRKDAPTWARPLDARRIAPTLAELLTGWTTFVHRPSREGGWQSS
jgi:hypothetical protein